MNENTPPEEIAEALDNARKVREMIASPGGTDGILPYLLETKKAHEQKLLNTDWQSLDEMNKCRFCVKAIDEVLSRIDMSIKDAEAIELDSAVEAGTEEDVQDE